MKKQRCYKPLANESFIDTEVRIMNEIEQERQFDELRNEAVNEGVSRSSLDELEKICGKSLPILKQHLANVRAQSRSFNAFMGGHKL